MKYSRRAVLRTAGWSAAAGLLPVPGLRGALFAAAANTDRILVVLHLRGGCDGLNLLSPASDAQFIEARASDLRVAAEGTDKGHEVRHMQPGAPEFRLHASAGALGELVDSGHLAFVHAAGLPDTTRSHFVATDMIERGVADNAGLNRSTSGWLTRATSAVAPDAAIPSVSAAPAPSGAWQGDARVISVADLNNGLVAPGGVQAGKVLNALYARALSNTAVSDAGRLTLASMQTIDARLTRDAHGKVVPYAPDAGVNYEAASEFGRPLRTLAQLIKMDLGLRAATIDLGGWDTHEYQAGRFKNQVERLSQGLGNFYNDLASYHDRLTVVVLTEFGRRLRSNRSNGTDHGRGSVMLVLGGDVAGGRIYGKWPGLKAEELEEGVDLAVANDYRQTLSEAVARWRVRPGPELFPGFTPGPPLSLFS